MDILWSQHTPEKLISHVNVRFCTCACIYKTPQVLKLNSFRVGTEQKKEKRLLPEGAQALTYLIRVTL